MSRSMSVTSLHPQIRNAYEADPGKRTSVAWEVRKLVSPSGPRHSSVNSRNRYRLNCIWDEGEGKYFSLRYYIISFWHLTLRSSSRSPIHSARGSRETLSTSARRNLAFDKLSSVDFCPLRLGDSARAKLKSSFENYSRLKIIHNMKFKKKCTKRQR